MEALALMNKSCEIIPDISLMKKMASISGTIPSRIMELVDNSIDAMIPGQILEVDVNILKRGEKIRLEVLDNGHGMSEEGAQRFWQLGKSQKDGEKKIGRFGLGSKVAILGIGDTCKIWTSPLGESCSFAFNFDIRKFSNWKVNYDVVPDDPSRHGTKIRIDNVTVRIGDIKRFCERLQEQFAKTYKHFIDKGQAVIRVNGKKVVPSKVELLPGYFQAFSFEVNGRRVQGWAGATKEAGTNWKFGFDLISSGRIIKSNDLLLRQAHTSLARLAGEIHLDDFPTDIHKTDFQRDHDDFQSMQETLLNQVLADLIAGIAKLTNREIFNKYGSEILNVSKTLNKVIRSREFLTRLDIEEGVFGRLKEKAKKRDERKPRSKAGDPVEEELLDVIELFDDELEGAEPEEDKKGKGKKPQTPPAFVINEPVGASLGVEHPLRRWSVYEKGGGAALNVEVNLDHPSYQSSDAEAGILVKNAVLDSVAEFILHEERKQGFVEDEIDRLNLLKDMLIRHAVKLA